MSKKILSALLAMTLVLSVGAALAEDPITLTYAEVNPLDTIVGQTGTAFKNKVEELSGGSIIIDIQASGVLGSEAQVLDGILGSISLSVQQLKARGRYAEDTF